jgi:hypothetical protein
MPRLARLDAAGVLHHIMIRGIERRKILNLIYYYLFVYRIEYQVIKVKIFPYNGIFSVFDQYAGKNPLAQLLAMRNNLSYSRGEIEWVCSKRR